MIRVVLFDMGGTLDGDGLHWLDRFVTLYAEAGVQLPRETVRSAFEEAERRATVDDPIRTSRIDQMIDCHVGWQLAHLGALGSIPPRPDLETLRRRLVEGFVGPVRAAAAQNARLLAELSARGLRLGVVSNGCGNVDVLCEELGYAPFLSLIVDSRWVGLYKPDPAIFIYAAAKLGVRAPNVLMVGDSFDRDIRPAKSVGMMTAWLQGPARRECPDPSLVDLCLCALTELPGALEMLSRTVA